MRVDWYQNHWDMIDRLEDHPEAYCVRTLRDYRTSVLGLEALAKELINVIRYIARGTERPSTSHPDLESLYHVETFGNCDCGYHFDMKFELPTWDREEFGESDVLSDGGLKTSILNRILMIQAAGSRNLWLKTRRHVCS